MIKSCVCSFELSIPKLLCVFEKQKYWVQAAHTHTPGIWCVWRHPTLFKDVSFPFVLIVFQPLLGAVLLHSLCCNTHLASGGMFSRACSQAWCRSRSRVPLSTHMPRVVMRISPRRRAADITASAVIPVVEIPRGSCRTTSTAATTIPSLARVFRSLNAMSLAVPVPRSPSLKKRSSFTSPITCTSESHSAASLPVILF